MTDVTDQMDRFTMGDVMSSEEIQIIIYSLDLTAGGGDLDDDGSGEEETGEFTEHTTLGKYTCHFTISTLLLGFLLFVKYKTHSTHYILLFQSSDDESVWFSNVTVDLHFQIHSYFHFKIFFSQQILDLSPHLCNDSNRLNCQLNTLYLISFPSIPVPSQLAVVTTSGNEVMEALNLSHTSNVSNISSVLSEELMSKELSRDTTEFKELVTKEL